MLYLQIVTESEFESRLQQLERQTRRSNFWLAACGIVAVIALAVAIRAVVPVLRVESAVRQVAMAFHAPSASSQNIDQAAAPSAPVSASSPPAVSPQPNKLLSIITLKVTGKHTFPKDDDAGRFNPETSFTFVTENHSDRGIRAYQGAVEVDDLLGNLIVRLQVEHQATLASHHSQQFTNYFEVNPFSDRDARMATEPFANLTFKWEPTKILFADGTSVEAQE